MIILLLISLKILINHYKKIKELITFSENRFYFDIKTVNNFFIT